MWHSVWASFLLLLLSSTDTLVTARSLSHSKDIFQHGTQLARRQAEEADTPDCSYVCSLDTCGGGSCSFARRDASGWPAPAGNHRHPAYYIDADSGANSSSSIDSGSSPLGKRAFNVLGKRITAAKADVYVRDYLLADDPSTVDKQFPSWVGFFTNVAGDMSTVSRQKTFGKTAFAYGTGGLHGCTMMALVSNRAVYMAHYWEGYTISNEDSIAGDDRTLWEERVLDSIRGVKVTNPYNPPNKPNLAYRAPHVGTTTGVNWSLFNKEGDNTQLIFMTPMHKDVTDPKSKSTEIMYPNKIGLVEQLVMDNIPGVKIIRRPYVRLRYRTDRNGEPVSGEDVNEVGRDARGMCLFQYDGAGNWRLFYQNAVRTSDDE